MDRRQVAAAAMRAGHGELTTRDDLATMRTEVRMLQWVVGLVAAIGLATFGCAVATLMIVLRAS